MVDVIGIARDHSLEVIVDTFPLEDANKHFYHFWHMVSKYVKLPSLVYATIFIIQN
jgi:hypothetical protein